MKTRRKFKWKFHQKNRKHCRCLQDACLVSFYFCSQHYSDVVSTLMAFEEGFDATTWRWKAKWMENRGIEERKSDTSLVVELFTAAYSVLTLQRQRHWRRLKQSVKSFLFILCCVQFFLSLVTHSLDDVIETCWISLLYAVPHPPRLQNVIVAAVDDWAENSIDLFFFFFSLSHSQLPFAIRGALEALRLQEFSLFCWDWELRFNNLIISKRFHHFPILLLRNCWCWFRIDMFLLYSFFNYIKKALQCLRGTAENQQQRLHQTKVHRSLFAFLAHYARITRETSFFLLLFIFSSSKIIHIANKVEHSAFFASLDSINYTTKLEIASSSEREREGWKIRVNCDTHITTHHQDPNSNDFVWEFKNEKC